MLVISSVLVTNEYYTKMLRNGGSESWTDATFRLTSYIRSVPAKSVLIMDWGILDTLRFLSGGTLPLLGPDAGNREAVAKIAADAGNLYVAHSKKSQFFPTNEAFLKFAAEAGYRRENLAVIGDSFGSPTFEVYRLTPDSH